MPSRDPEKNREYQRKWYRKNKALHAERVKSSMRKRRRKRKIESIYLLGGKCQRCGYNKNIAALVFHHINKEEKESEMDFGCWSWKRIKKELDKCQLLCANCHSEEHYPDMILLPISREP